jgi:integrase/recombinase XerD
MSSLREQMKRSMELKGYSINTQKAYLRCVAEFAKHHKKSPDLLGTAEIKDYLHLLLSIKERSHSFLNTNYSALKYFFETTLGRTWNVKAIPRTKTPKQLPSVLSAIEVKELFDTVTNIKHKAILMTIYAAGLRVSEAANLKVTDIDSKNMQIRIQQAKGKKDRYTLLSHENLQILREYWKYCKPKFWLFPGYQQDKPLTTRSIQKIFEKAKNKAGIRKQVSVHTLRHCFATHLLEAGTGIYHIQNLLGHTSPKTTNIYLHLTRKDLLNVRSPLDRLKEITHD